MTYNCTMSLIDLQRATKSSNDHLQWAKVTYIVYNEPIVTYNELQQVLT